MLPRNLNAKVKEDLVLQASLAFAASSDTLSEISFSPRVSSALRLRLKVLRAFSMAAAQLCCARQAGSLSYLDHPELWGIDSSRINAKRIACLAASAASLSLYGFRGQKNPFNPSFLRRGTT
jgi:hypothetical protein